MVTSRFSRSRAASHHRPAAREAFKNFHQDFAANVFDDQIRPMLVRDAAHFSRPIGIAAVHHEIRAQACAQIALGLAGCGADDARAEGFCNLDRSRTHAAGSAHDQHPIPAFHFRAVSEHVHRRAARKCRCAAEASKSTPAGNRTKTRSCTTTFSAKPASHCIPSNWPRKQSDSSPRRQNSHSPQNKLDWIATPVTGTPEP